MAFEEITADNFRTLAAAAAEQPLDISDTLEMLKTQNKLLTEQAEYEEKKRKTVTLVLSSLNLAQILDASATLQELISDHDSSFQKNWDGKS